MEKDIRYQASAEKLQGKTATTRVQNHLQEICQKSGKSLARHFIEIDCSLMKTATTQDISIIIPEKAVAIIFVSY